MPHDEIAVMKLLQSRGFRVTRQRLLILDAICEGEGHSTAAEVVQRAKELDNSIDQSTVHRTLAVLCKLGLVATNVDSSRDTVYEVVGPVPHHHLKCTVCGIQLDVPHEWMAPVFASVAHDYGFIVTAKHLVLDGVCERCARAEP